MVQVDKMTTTTSPSITMIPLDKIVSSGINPRLAFDAERLAELATSIRNVGVLQPLTVRMIGRFKTYQVVCGDRRLRASREAGLKTVPCIVKELNDAEAFELTITENLQREDIHPLEEAAAYLSLVKGKFDIASIALKFGKSENYIRTRIKMNDLIEPFKTLFLRDKIGIALAMKISTIAPDGQTILYDQEFYNSDSTTWEPMSMRDLDWKIERSLSAKLDDADLFLYDTELLPGIPACNVCPDNTNSNYGLFPNEGEGRCMNVTCLQKKKDAYFMQRLQSVHESHPEIAIGKDSYLDDAEKKTLKVIGEKEIPVCEFSYDSGFRKLNPPTPPTQPDPNDFSDDEADELAMEMEDYREELAKYNEEVAAFQKKIEDKQVIKVFMTTGYDRGKVVNFVPTGTKEIPEGLTPTGVNTAQEIKVLQDKLDRNNELAYEKLYTNAGEFFRNSNYPVREVPVSHSETKAFMFFVHEHTRISMTKPKYFCSPEALMSFNDAHDVERFRYWLRSEMNFSYPNSNKEKVALFFDIITEFYPHEMAEITADVEKSYAKRNHALKLQIISLKTPVEKPDMKSVGKKSVKVAEE